MALYIGIDPGVAGGLASIDGGVISYKPMPDMQGVLNCLSNWKLHRTGNVYIAVEEVRGGSFTKNRRQGVTSAFTFGMNYGAIHMALTAVFGPNSFELVEPKKWQKTLGITFSEKTGEDNEDRRARKQVLLYKAKTLFPLLTVWGKSKESQQSVCDALLIAEYCRRSVADA